MTSVELSLSNKYKQIINFNTIQSYSQNSILIGSGTINNNLIVNNNTLLNNSLSINSSLNVSGSTIINGNLSINSNLNIQGNSNINFISVNSNISISGNTNLFNLTTNSIFINGNTYISGNTTINSSLILMNINSNNLLINSSLNVSGNTKINGSLTLNSPLSITSYSLLNNLSINSNLYISNNSIIQGNTTILNNLYVSNTSILLGNNTIISSFNVSGLSLIPNFISITSDLNISNNLKLNNTYISKNLFVSSNSILNGISLNSFLIVSGNTILNNVSNNSSLFISGNSIIQSNVSINSTLNISGSAILNNLLVTNNISFNSSININTLNINNLNTSGNFVTKLPEYLYNEDAYLAGIPLWGLYRTGGIVRIRIDINPIYITLQGLNPIILYVGDSYVDPGLKTYMMVNINSTETISTYITSIIASDLGNVLNSNILIQSNNTPISNSIINTSTNRSFTITYTATSSNNLTSSITRILNVYQIPIINSIILSANQKQLNILLTGLYYYSTYYITLNGSLVISETVFNTNIIDISSLTSNLLAYTITINLKRSSGTILTSKTLTFNLDKSPPIITTTNPLNLTLFDNPIFNIYTSVSAIDLPTNNIITLEPSNIILIQDSRGNNISIPSNGLLNTLIDISYTIIYTITDSYDNNSIIPFVVNITSFPLVLNDVFYWIDANDNSTITTNNGIFISIKDKSINQITMIPYIGTPNITNNGINNLKVLDCTNGSSIWSSSKYMNSYNVTVAVVTTCFNNHTEWGCIWGHYKDGGGRDTDITIEFKDRSNIVHFQTNDDNNNVQITYPTYGTPVLYIGTLTNGTSRFFKMINLITGATTTVTGNNPLTMILQLNPIRMGSSELSNELACNYIGECMYWQRVLLDSEILIIQNYLINKWSNF